MSEEPTWLSAALQTNADPQLTVTLPRSAWAVIVGHLQIGRYLDVATVIMALVDQTTPQLEAANKAAQLQAAEKARAPEWLEAAMTAPQATEKAH